MKLAKTWQRDKSQHAPEHRNHLVVVLLYQKGPGCLNRIQEGRYSRDEANRRKWPAAHR